VGKLTISFKGHLIAIYHLEDRPVPIGSDPDCEVSIDSLAVGPRHALVSAHPEGYTIAALDPDHPVVVNNETVKQAPLHHGDLIQIGKHTLHFAEAAQEVAVMPVARQAAAPSAGAKCAATNLAYVQIQSGPEIGRVLALGHGSTPMIRAGAERLVITRRNDGYFAACDQPEATLAVNGTPVEPGTEAALPNAAVVEFGDLRCQFFCAGIGSI
jgi:hypothetical protein